MPDRRFLSPRSSARRRATADVDTPAGLTEAAPPAAAGWPQSELAGYHDLSAPDAVRLAYRVILEREPDPDGLAHQIGLLEGGGLTRDGLIEALLTSDERRFREGPTGDRESGGPRAIWPSFPPPGYLGQLRPEFQKSLAEERAALGREDCRFYSSIDLPGEAIGGPWDVRGREHLYLGNVDVADKRVLEMGPASGYLSFWMEQQGADVVGMDCGFDRSIDLHPAPGMHRDTRRLRNDHARMVSDFQHAFWYCHKRLQSRVKMVYGNVYELPGDIGDFDIATFGAILLHLKSPITALEQAAGRTRKTIVVTDTWSGGEASLMENIMRPFPLGESGRWVIWWEISAGAVVSMLEVLGFSNTTVTSHTQLHQMHHDEASPYVEFPMFTVIGERP